MREAADGNGLPHSIPAQCFGEMGDHFFEGDAFEWRALAGFWRGRHSGILPSNGGLSAYNVRSFCATSYPMTDSIRLAKRLVELTQCSRREAELYIAGGWVSVDGVVVEEPQFRVGEQQVVLHPKASAIPVAPITIAFHQAADLNLDTHTFSAATHTPDDHSGVRMLKQHFIKLTHCLPLQTNASGLSVFTQDFQVSRKLTADAATIEQEYVVEVLGELSADGLKLLNHGLIFNGKPLAPAKVSWQNETRLRFALKGVLLGQIAFMCQAVGLEIKSMKRLRIGRVSMSKLASGQWRYLAGYERF